MNLSRRALLLTASAAAIVPSAFSQASPFAAAARYSADHRGVSMVVMREGKVLFTDYPRPGKADAGWELASGTKSFTGIMAAAAQKDGLLDIEEPCATTLPEWANDARSKITIRHLLSLTSGLDGQHATARPPAYADAIKAKAKHAPGAKFEYGPTPFQCFGEILVRKLKAAKLSPDPQAWLQSRVLDRIGVKVSDWKRGADGHPFLPQGAHLTGPNWARFGRWVMDGADGVDKRVYEALFTPSKANPGYGLSWWLLRPGLIGPSPRAGVDEETIGEAALDEDVVMAAGAGDQRLYLIRKRNLVVVRQANRIGMGMIQRRNKWSDGDFLKLVLQAV